MHEWAFAEGIVNTAIEESKRRNISRLSKVVIVLGELQSIEKDIVEFAIDNLKKDTPACEADFVFETEQVKFECRNCGNRWLLSDIEPESGENEIIRESIHYVPEVAHSFFSCPSCGSKDFEIVQGRGVYIKTLEGFQ